MSIMNFVSKCVSYIRFGTLSNQTPLPENWHDSLAAASEAARVSNKPVLVKVHADWCGYCKNFDEEAGYVPLLMNKLGRYSCARVAENSKEGRKLKKEHKIISYPTFLVFRQDVCLGKIRGYKNAPMFVDALNSFDEQVP